MITTFKMVDENIVVVDSVESTGPVVNEYFFVINKSEILIMKLCRDFYDYEKNKKGETYNVLINRKVCSPDDQTKTIRHI